jgi:predicted membrane protein
MFMPLTLSHIIFVAIVTLTAFATAIHFIRKRKGAVKLLAVVIFFFLFALNWLSILAIFWKVAITIYLVYLLIVIKEKKDGRPLFSDGCMYDEEQYSNDDAAANEEEILW